MPDITLLTQTELRHLVPLDVNAVVCVEAGFKTLASGQVVIAPHPVDGNRRL